MRHLITFLLFSALLAHANVITAAPGIWKKVNGTSALNGAPAIIPDKYEVYSLNIAYLKGLLSNLSEEPSQGQVLDIPSPEGSLKKYRIWQTPIMEQPLVDKYPQLKTFTGYREDNKAVTIKLDFTDFGFHAMVFDGNETYLIDPYSEQPSDYYICYRKSDYSPSPATSLSCLNADESAELGGEAMYLNGAGLPPMALKVNGAVKRTFRLALACTGEYAVAVAGSNPTKSAVLSKMITSMNRVNGIYEKEVAVTMTLVANNDNIVFLNGSTDPYTNNNGSTMLGQNKTTLDNLIGAANYDIGHVFSTGGGGIAILGSVCKTDKAKGVTGQPNPQGDAFDVDFVAHEMGHQFGSDHSFNSGISQCGFNAVSNQAYEPGSGTTIMAYAGLCGGDNIQTQGNDYFHATSLKRITDFLSSPTGASCASVTPSGNIPPVVPPFSQTYAIPTLTPFELTAPQAVDVDHDQLTYCWEQWNLGDFKKSFFQVRSSGPLFRSFSPDTSRTRVFPRMDKVIAGVTSYLGEKLPDTSRYLTFKLTVRDVLNGIGTFNFPDDTVHLDVISTAGPFKVLTPASSSINWSGGTNQTITWDVANTHIAPISCSLVDIYLSEDGGNSFPHLVKANTLNDGSEQVLIPNIVTTNQARILVKASGNVFFNVNPVSFTITHDPNNVAEVAPWERQISIYPVPASDVLNISLSNNMKLQVKITNSMGQSVWNGEVAKTLAIPVSAWAKGFYYVQLWEPNSGAGVVKPLVVQ